MVHVIFNLVKNALRAIAAAGTGKILIEARTAPGAHLLLVSDTGRGIEPATLPYIFVPFVTGHGNSGGAGIGLSFCRRVIEDFDGSIVCFSAPGKGTTFEIRLPVVEAKRCTARPAPGPPLLMLQAQRTGPQAFDGTGAASTATMPDRPRP